MLDGCVRDSRLGDRGKKLGCGEGIGFERAFFADRIGESCLCEFGSGGWGRFLRTCFRLNRTVTKRLIISSRWSLVLHLSHTLRRSAAGSVAGWRWQTTNLRCRLVRAGPGQPRGKEPELVVASNETAR